MGLLPVPPDRRKRLLARSGNETGNAVSDSFQQNENQLVRTSRESCGCSCEGICYPETCECYINDIGCQVCNFIFITHDFWFLFNFCSKYFYELPMSLLFVGVFSNIFTISKTIFWFDFRTIDVRFYAAGHVSHVTKIILIKVCAKISIFEQKLNCRLKTRFLTKNWINND